MCMYNLIFLINFDIKIQILKESSEFLYKKHFKLFNECHCAPQYSLKYYTKWSTFNLQEIF